MLIPINLSVQAAAEKGIDWSAATTAGATVVLAFFTIALALYTRQLVGLARQPFVVVTIDPNPQALMYVDFTVVNEGNSSAFDVSISFEPPLPLRESTEDIRKLPFGRIGVLRAGQQLTSDIGSYGDFQGKSFRAKISWRKTPTSTVEELEYDVSMVHYEGYSHLGNDYGKQSADALKKLSDDLNAIAGGRRRVGVDTFNSAERVRERRDQMRRHRAWRRQHEPEPGPATSIPPGGDPNPDDV